MISTLETGIQHMLLVDPDDDEEEHGRKYKKVKVRRKAGRELNIMRRHVSLDYWTLYYGCCDEPARHNLLE